MRRIAVIATALFVLAAAGTAYAATKVYTGHLSFSSNKAGSAKKPRPLAYRYTLQSTTPSGLRPPIQKSVQIKIYGLKVDGKDFPTCSSAQIAKAKNDNVCPHKALFGIGYIRALLGPATSFSAPGENCDPALDVWNSGQGKLTFFFVTNPAHMCLGGALKTGSTPPYPGTYKQQGKYFVSNVNIPNYINYPLPGLAGSLQYEQLVFTTQSERRHGKTIISQAAVGCLKGKRPYSITTATTGGVAGPGNHKSTISSSARCKG